MKKLSSVCIITLASLSAGQAFALPGVYTAGAASMTLDIGQCETRTISLDGTGFDTPLLIRAVFLFKIPMITWQILPIVSAMTER